MKKILISFGTRPEAVKMCPLVIYLQREREYQVEVCVTGQHREMLRSVLEIFHVVPEYDLDIMSAGQTLTDITAEILRRMEDVLDRSRPDLVLVHGDTTTTFAVALSCFYRGVEIGHVEAGLRTYDMASPFPEEFNRQAVDKISSIYFAPTALAVKNLTDEKISPERIYQTGNTVIDAFATTVQPDYASEELDWSAGSRLVLLTMHRRENWGRPMEEIFSAVQDMVEKYQDVKVIYPVHKNPIVRQCAEKYFGGIKRVHLIEPLDVIDFHNYISRAHLIVTDSGGIQEEAPSFGIPVLVARNVTERTEGISAGTARLLGNRYDGVYAGLDAVLGSREEYSRMKGIRNPYGDGNACRRIAEAMRHFWEEQE